MGNAILTTNDEKEIKKIPFKRMHKPQVYLKLKGINYYYKLNLYGTYVETSILHFAANDYFYFFFQPVVIAFIIDSVRNFVSPDN